MKAIGSTIRTIRRVLEDKTEDYNKNTGDDGESTGGDDKNTGDDGESFYGQ